MVAKTAGSFLGGFFNNPGLVAIAGIGLALFIFRDKISDFVQKGFDSFKLPEFPDINFPDIVFPEFPTFPDINFPDINFPEFPPFFGPPAPIPPPPGPIPDEDFPLKGVITPEGCTILPNGVISCPTPPTFDVCATFPELCQDEPFVKTPAEIAEEEAFKRSLNPPTPPPPPPIIIPLPPGFEGGGPSFIGGSITETPITCNSSLGFIIDKLGVTASQASDIRAQACNDFGDFDFGDNTGSGFGPGEDQTGPLITGGATLESEAKKACCVTCDLFGLNCGCCAGSI